MLVGLHKNRFNKPTPFMDRFESILTYNGIDCIRLDSSASDFCDRVSKVDFYICRSTVSQYDLQIARTTLPIVERELAVKCFPNHATSWAYDDKIREHLLLKSKGFPVIDAWFFWERDIAIKWTESEAIFPLVFKLKGGAGSGSVILVKNARQAKKLIDMMFLRCAYPGKLPFWSSVRSLNLRQYFYEMAKSVVKNAAKRSMGIYLGTSVADFQDIHANYVYFQKFLPDNQYDTRVVIIGNRAFAFKRFNRKNDFRSSGSGHFDIDPGKIDLAHIKTAFEVSNAMGFQSMAYDFLYDESGRSMICEMSYTYPDKTLSTCPGYWDADLNWNEGHYWPQYFILMDLLNMPALKQPKLTKDGRIIDC